MGKCLAKLDKIQEAELVFKEALKNLENKCKSNLGKLRRN